jgi:hypothetical protein
MAPRKELAERSYNAALPVVEEIHPILIPGAKPDVDVDVYKCLIDGLKNKWPITKKHNGNHQRPARSSAAGHAC